MNSIDFLILAIVAVSGVLGLYWGIIRQVLSIVGLIAGIVLAGRYAPSVAEWLSSFIRDNRVADVLGFVAVLLAVSSLASLLASVLHRFAGLLFLGWIDHLLGGLLGLLQGAIIATVILAVLAANPNEALAEALRNSQYAGRVLQAFGFVTSLLPENIRAGVDLFFNRF